MKKLLIATVLLVLATLTETPDEYILGSGNQSQVDAYLTAWANAEAEGVIPEDPDSAQPVSDVRTDQMEIDRDAKKAI